MTQTNRQLALELAAYNWNHDDDAKFVDATGGVHAEVVEGVLSLADRFVAWLEEETSAPRVVVDEATRALSTSGEAAEVARRLPLSDRETVGDALHEIDIMLIDYRSLIGFREAAHARTEAQKLRELGAGSYDDAIEAAIRAVPTTPLLTDNSKKQITAGLISLRR